ncbi:glycerophosphodiester phosphodiesterase, partial [Aquimarina litoralis]|uniref:glycerophosphodiester phosphodiesterase n=1 Tax=Aquimarina litoralis TaxID=584605 RepID=UPI001C5A54B1
MKKVIYYTIIGLFFVQCTTDDLTIESIKENDIEIDLYKQAYSGIWNGSARSFPVSPTGNKLAVSCHNCYSPENSARLAPTLDIIHKAQQAGADLIELDVYQRDNTLYINHDRQDSGTLPLSQVLADHQLKAGDQLLFIEIKSNSNPSSIGQKLVTLLDQYQYISRSRPVVIRSFDDGNLDYVKNYINNHPLKDYIFLSRLFGEGSSSSDQQWHNAIRNQYQKGRKMVEFNYRSPNIMSKIMYAKSLGLATNLFTLTNFSEVYVAAMRNDLDAITIEGGYRNKPSNIALSRTVIQESSQLAYTNVALQSFQGNSYQVYDRRNTKWFNLFSANAPTLELSSAGKSLFGKSLQFNASRQQSVRTWDNDNSTNGGFLVTAVVDFDDLSLSPNETQAIVQKADAAGFALELHRSNTGSSVLRFGVYVNGRYHYSSLPTSTFNSQDSYLLIG